MSLTKEFLKMLKGAWLVIVLQAVFYAAILIGAWYLIKPYYDAILRKLQQ